MKKQFVACLNLTPKKNGFILFYFSQVKWRQVPLTKLYSLRTTVWELVASSGEAA